MNAPPSIESAARARIARAEEQIERSILRISQGNPLAAERDPYRLQRRLQAKAHLSSEGAAAVAAGIRELEGRTKAGRRVSGKARAAAASEAGAERIYGTIDFVNVSFLERGVSAGRAVGRVAFRDGRAQGSGFLVSDRLFLTNNHVIASPAEAARFVVEFDYELDVTGRQREMTRFALDPGAFFETSDRDNLDFAVVALGARLSGPRDLRDLGWCALSDASDKHALGEWANVVQHPDGRFKEVVIRENRLVSRLDTVLHYLADTEPGSSGSPVFNNEWQVIALHHWGGPWRQTKDDRGRRISTEVNEGIRISAIVKELKARAGGLDTGRRALLQRVLTIGESAAFAPVTARRNEIEESGMRLAEDGTATWRLPIEVSVRLPVSRPPQPPAAAAAPAPAAGPGDALSAERTVHIDRNYDNRPGYNSAFVTGHRIDLPRLSGPQRALAARNVTAVAGEDPHELKYQHFSIVLNKKRKLAFFTACNIDGRSSKAVDRRTGAVSPRVPSPGGDEAAGPEASEDWFADDRLHAVDQTTQDLYDSQEVPGHPNKQTRAWQSRMFQRGHLVRRADPAWGTDSRALRADADTFHFANCTPQVGFFNMGSAPRSTPRSGGGQLWRAIEDYVLENAVDEQKRVCVFTGPVLDDQRDLPWRQDVIPGFLVPTRFWKIVVWAEGGELKATAMLADQGPVIEVMPESLERGESFVDTARVRDFVATVEDIERLTGLTFDDAVRQADIHRGEARRGATGAAGGRSSRLRAVTSFEEIGMGRVIRVRRAPKAAKISRATGTRKAAGAKKGSRETKST
jgi:endonuclease G